MAFIVEPGELIKIRHNFHNALLSSGLKPFIVEAGELIKIRHNFQSPIQEF